jgi:glycosyltransferase involved in cell wall biosynthesis
MSEQVGVETGGMISGGVAALPRPQVQVVMPTYQRLPYLQESVRAVLAQTFEAFTLHVSDNASTDGTAEWLESLDDPRVTWSRHPVNIGWLGNINSCFERISPETDYTVVFHDDDLMHPRFLERTVAFLDHHPEAGFVHTAFDLIAADGSTISTGVDWTHGLSGDLLEPREDFIAESMRWNCRVCTSSIVLRNAAIPAERYLSIDDPCPDFGLWLRMTVDWDAGFLGEALIGCRVHGGSASADVGALDEQGYFFTTKMIDGLHDVKVRFLEAYGDRLSSPAELRRVAEDVYRTALIDDAGRAALPERRRVPSLKRLAGAMRREPRLTVDPRAWRFVLGTLAGPRIVDRVRSRRASRGRSQNAAH